MRGQRHGARGNVPPPPAGGIKVKGHGARAPSLGGTGHGSTYPRTGAQVRYPMPEASDTGQGTRTAKGTLEGKARAPRVKGQAHIYGLGGTPPRGQGHAPRGACRHGQAYAGTGQGARVPIGEGMHIAKGRPYGRPRVMLWGRA